MLFSVPAMIAGAVAGWTLALERSESSLIGFEAAYMDAVPPDAMEVFWRGRFGEDAVIPAFIAATRVLDITADLWMGWLPILAAVAFVVMLAMLAFASARAMNRPVLALLQGGSARAKPPKSGKVAAESGAEADVSQFAPARIYLQKLAKSRLDAVKNSLIHIVQHICRAPAQSALRLFVAMFFIFTLGWISESITRTNDEIDRLYDTTIVWGEVGHQARFLTALGAASAVRPGLDADGVNWTDIRTGWDIHGQRMYSHS